MREEATEDNYNLLVETIQETTMMVTKLPSSMLIVLLLLQWLSHDTQLQLCAHSLSVLWVTWGAIKSKLLCFNFLRGGHATTQYQSQFRRSVCHQPHHTTLHVASGLQSSLTSPPASVSHLILFRLWKRFTIKNPLFCDACPTTATSWSLFRMISFNSPLPLMDSRTASLHLLLCSPEHHISPLSPSLPPGLRSISPFLLAWASSVTVNFLLGPLPPLLALDCQIIRLLSGPLFSTANLLHSQIPPQFLWYFAHSWLMVFASHPEYKCGH